MDTNKIIKNVLWGVSALVGFVVAEGVYRAGVKAVDEIEERKLIGDGEVISEEIVEEVDELTEDDMPF